MTREQDDAFKAHVKRNRQLLNDLEKRKADVRTATEVEFFFAGVSRQQLAQLGRELGTVGYRCEKPAQVGDDSEPEFAMSCTKTTPIADAASEETTRHLVDVAAAHGSSFDGWGAET